MFHMPAVIIEGLKRPARKRSEMTLPRRKGRDRSRQYVVDDAPVVDLQPTPAGDFEPPIVQAEQAQDGGVQIGDVVALAEGVIAKFVRGAVDVALLQARAGHPDREA